MMKLEDLGFNPVIGKSYVITFTVDGELSKTMEYNGTPFVMPVFSENSKVTLSVNDKITGKELYSADFYQYNGSLYKAALTLPLKTGTNNMNANVYIKDVHYDLASGNILISIQGFQGDSYSLVVANTTTNTKSLTLPVTLADNTYYSLPTELVQGNKFEITLTDSRNVPLDSYVFTAPSVTDYRYTGPVTESEVSTVADSNVSVQPVTPPPLVVSTPQPVTTVTAIELAPLQAQEVKGEGLNVLLISSVVGALVLLVVLAFVVVRKVKNKRNAQMEESYEEEEYEDSDEGVTEEDLEQPDNSREVTRRRSPFPSAPGANESTTASIK